MAFLDKNGLQTLTNKLVQGDAIKVASHRGHTVTNVIDNITRECENIATPNTMTLENKVNEFKVGKGRNVDVSGDVEEGKVEVELQGKTYHNLCDSNASASIQYTDDYKVEDTEERLKITRNAENYNGWFYFSNRALKVNMLKPNTTYTVFFKYESISNNIPRLQFMLGNATQWLSDAFNSIIIKDNIYRCIIKTASSFEDKEVGKQVIYFHNAQPKKVGDSVVLYKNMLLLEGDYSDLSVEELPNYFEGIKSSFEDGVIDVEVTGKNLFNFEDANILSSAGVTYTQTGNNFEVTSNSNSPAFARTSVKHPANLFAGKTITLSCKAIKSVNNTSPSVQIYYRDENNKAVYISFWNSRSTHTFPKKISTDFVELGLYTNNTKTTGIVNTINVSEIMAEEASLKTSYEPYYKKKISFNIEEPLRRLPNGVYDEITGDGKLIRRVGKVVLNGSENWNAMGYGGHPTRNTFETNITIEPVGTATKAVNSFCDRFIYDATTKLPKEDNHYRVSHTENANGNKCYFLFCPDVNTIPHRNVTAWKQWLSENPTTVYYELSTPIITSIKLIDFDVKPLATMTINSEIAPISNHKVVLNRAGQIEQGIVQIAELKKRVDNLETTYDSYLLETQHKLSILGFEYELESEEI